MASGRSLGLPQRSAGVPQLGDPASSGCSCLQPALQPYLPHAGAQGWLQNRPKARGAASASSLRPPHLQTRPAKQLARNIKRKTGKGGDGAARPASLPLTSWAPGAPLRGERGREAEGRARGGRGGAERRLRGAPHPKFAPGPFFNPGLRYF